MHTPIQNATAAGPPPASSLVALEHVAGRGAGDVMRCFRRSGPAVTASDEPFRPFLWLAEPALLTGGPVKAELELLAGEQTLRGLALFSSWQDLQKAVAWLKKQTGSAPADPGAPYLLINDPAQQHLMLTGRSLFQDMTFRDLRRLQVDIETYCGPGFEFSSSARESDRIIAIALADESGWTAVLSGAEMDEASLLRQFVAAVQERDPDVIEGHNLMKFDLPYLAARARRHGVTLGLGRDGSAPAVRPSRFVAAEQIVAYPRADIFGRHVIDTYFLALAYDATHRSLESLSLKDIARHFGVAPPDRLYIDGADIAATFDRDPAAVMRYALDDIRETRAISDLLSPSYFIQARLLPLTYQNVAVRGSGTRIDSLLLGEYLRGRHALPRPGAPQPFEGGLAAVFQTGVIRNVHHCDVRSLYPSIMLKDGIRPATDTLAAFPRLLRQLRDLRVEAKRRQQEAATAEERNHQGALQTALKILINSFYGYLGFAHGRFNDFAAAARVAAEGRALLTAMLDRLRALGGGPVEIDTDGIYFVPPPFADATARDRFRVDLQAALPAGIDVEFDGEYPAMLSYRMKNYALLDDAGGVIVKGAALKSRGLEPYLRDYIRAWLRLMLAGSAAGIAELKAEYREAVGQRRWPIARLARTETLQEAPATYLQKVGGKARGRNAAYELALRSGRDYRAGDPISYYVTGARKSVAVHEAARRVDEWDPGRRDENTAFYLAKLDALIAKFDAIEKGEPTGSPEPEEM